MYTPMAQGGYFAGQQNQSPMGMQPQGQMQQYPMMSNQPQYPSQNWYGGVPAQQGYGGMQRPQQSNWYGGGGMGGYGGGYSQPMQAQPPQPMQQQYPQHFGGMQQSMTMMNQGMGQQTQGGMPQQMPQQAQGQQAPPRNAPMTSGAAFNGNSVNNPLPQVSKSQYDATIAGMRGIGYTDGMIRNTGWDPGGYNPSAYSQPGDMSPQTKSSVVSGLSKLGYNQDQLKAMGYA